MTTLEQAGQLRQEINQLRNGLQLATTALRRLEANCQHHWSAVTACSIHEPAYTIPGDPPGTMGSDWRGPVYVPARIIPQWQRHCLTCGKEEKTQRTTTSLQHHPAF